MLEAPGTQSTATQLFTHLRRNGNEMNISIRRLFFHVQADFGERFIGCLIYVPPFPAPASPPLLNVRHMSDFFDQSAFVESSNTAGPMVHNWAFCEFVCVAFNMHGPGLVFWRLVRAKVMPRGDGDPRGTDQDRVVCRTTAAVAVKFPSWTFQCQPDLLSEFQNSGVDTSLTSTGCLPAAILLTRIE